MKEATQRAELLEAYGHAQADAALLNIVLQQLASSADMPPGMDQTFVRSINRAEREMHEIKVRYEEGP